MNLDVFALTQRFMIPMLILGGALLLLGLLFGG